MLIPLRRLVRGAAGGGAAALRGRLRRAARGLDDDELALARRMRELRVEISASLGQVQACGGCCEAMPDPGRGGHCCGSRTEDVFVEDEVAALAAAGTRGRHLRAPEDPLPGCAFRGSLGCSLEAAHRPNVCIRYLCGELRAELAGRGDLVAILERVDELEELYCAFIERRGARREREWLAAIDPRLVG